MCRLIIRVVAAKPHSSSSPPPPSCSSPISPRDRLKQGHCLLQAQSRLSSPGGSLTARTFRNAPCCGAVGQWSEHSSRKASVFSCACGLPSQLVAQKAPLAAFTIVSHNPLTLNSVCVVRGRYRAVLVEVYVHRNCGAYCSVYNNKEALPPVGQLMLC